AKSDGQAQHSNILVSEGDTVTQGQVIGYLHKGHPSHTHVHLGLYVDGNTICPAKYFNDAARASIQSLTRGGAPLCYYPLPLAGHWLSGCIGSPSLGRNIC
ncbi:MAG TPA: hypothetical protein QF597_05480, partial [Arenicellales bacterium]|nr:hypothetical protein [Arenicellales bacterium]